MKVVCDTGPLLAASDRRSGANRLAAGILRGLGRRAVILDVVLVEIDYMLRRRAGPEVARRFLHAVESGAYLPAFLSPGLLSRAAELDAQYADLDLGLVDAAIMSYAERHDLPIFTFDFRHFRATESKRGPWRLLVSEQQLARRCS